MNHPKNSILAEGIIYGFAIFGVLCAMGLCGHLIYKIIGIII